MTTSRSRAVLGVILGIALAATAVWLALLLARGDQPHQATQPPPTAAATTSPTETTTAPAFTRDGAVAALQLLVKQRLEAFNTLNESTLRSVYTADCHLADGRPCLKDDLATLNDLKRKNHRLPGYPTEIQEIRVLTWEPETRTAVLRLVYEALPAKIVNAEGHVVETIPGSKRIVDQVNLVWNDGRWRQAWAGSIEES
ncbi:MAG TPA: hypothetical protein VNK73_19845 [Actinomycetota bacterium]|nr:hypothetical protein [Actinomycetota bacterium]